MPEVKINLIPNEDGELIYFAGEQIQGSLQLTIDRNIKIREVAVKFVGKSSMKISKRSNSHTYDTQKYLDERITLYVGKEQMELQAGSYNYPFAFQLSNNLPQSTQNSIYEKYEKYNTIKYSCEGTLDLPWKFDEKFKQPFILKRRDNLNCFPILREPMVRSIDANLYGFNVFRPEKLIINVSLPQSGFIRGDTIEMKIDIDNQSGVKIERMSVALEEVKLCRIANMKKFDDETFAQSYLAGIEPHSANKIVVALKIPDGIRTTDVLWSKWLKIKHYIKVVANTEGMHLKKELSIPIYIGTIQLGDYKVPPQDETEIQKHLSKQRPGDSFKDKLFSM